MSNSRNSRKGSKPKPTASFSFWPKGFIEAVLAEVDKIPLDPRHGMFDSSGAFAQAWEKVAKDWPKQSVLP